MIPRMKKLFCSPLAGVALLLSVQMQAASFGADKKLEISSYWESDSEVAALDALFQATKRADPGHSRPIGILVKAQKKWLAWLFNSVTRRR